MSLPQPTQTGYTIEDWVRWDGRWELIHGVAYDMTPSPGFEHQRVSMQLGSAIHAELKAARHGHDGTACEVVAAPIDLFLPGEQSVYQPDLVVVCDPGKVTPRGIEGIPDLVVEILSPSTALRDLNEKRQAYEAAGVPEYLIINPSERAGLLLRLVDGRYEDAANLEWGAMVGLMGGLLPVQLGA
jgi:Uma2 family endonuclease